MIGLTDTELTDKGGESERERGDKQKTNKQTNLCIELR